MKDDDARLIETGVAHARLLQEEGLRPGSAVLDVGSCYGRLPLGLLAGTDFRGRYLGFDVLRKQVEWCQAALTPRFPHLRFAYLDVRNDRYNPHGTVDPTTVRFPADTARFDVVTLFSIFTHFYRADIERYLREIRRVLKPGGVAVSTWFVFDDARLPRIVSPAAAYPMVHVLDEHTRYAETTDPLRAIAFAESLIRELATAAGLRVLKVDRGTWAGEPGRIFQDVVVLQRPGGPRATARATAGRVKRAVLPRARRGVRRVRRRVAAARGR